MKVRLSTVFHWIGCLCYYVFVILLMGTLIGALSHLAIGWLIIDRPDPIFFLARGALNGFYYSGIWAGGVSIVLCFMRGHRERSRRSRTNASSQGRTLSREGTS